jgi:hypothetical protein
MASTLCSRLTLNLRGSLLCPAYNAENATIELDTLRLQRSSKRPRNCNTTRGRIMKIDRAESGGGDDLVAEGFWIHFRRFCFAPIVSPFAIKNGVQRAIMNHHGLD